MLNGEDQVATDAQQPLVLLVDDFDDARQLYAEYLGGCGFRVAEAVDGNQALEKAFALRPDVIVMDLTLPGIDGWTAIRQLKSDERTGSIPVLAMSGHSRDLHRRHDDPQNDRKLGWDVYLTKPCLPDELLATIQRMLSR
ncbi:MAG TPA: response regulator [Polyangia bacterium]|jgi:CheY-like chemotaxis protein|nr:response regulator [Polyangia bacterium]